MNICIAGLNRLLFWKDYIRQAFLSITRDYTPAIHKRNACGEGRAIHVKGAKVTIPSFFPFTPAWSKFKDCNVDKKPASAFVTKLDASASTVKKIQDILMVANLADLKTGGIVSSSVENLVPYENTAKKYVGSYGDHYNALTDGPTACGTTTPNLTPTSTSTPTSTPTLTPTSTLTLTPTSSTTSAASSALVSFTLSIIAIFAFLQSA